MEARGNAPPGLKEGAERGGFLREVVGGEGSKSMVEFHSHFREDQG